MITRHQPLEARRHETPVPQGVGDALLGLGRGRHDLPGIVARRIGAQRALEGDVLEAEAQPADFRLRAERGRERDQRAARHGERGDRAILDLDGIDPGGGAREDRRDRSHQIGHDVVRVDPMGQQHAAELGLPTAVSTVAR